MIRPGGDRDLTGAGAGRELPLDPRWGMALVALYTGSATVAELDDWARTNLPSASRPRDFARVPELPRNAMGKLLRHALPGLIPD